MIFDFVLQETMKRIKEDEVDVAQQPDGLNERFSQADTILTQNLTVSRVVCAVGVEEIDGPRW